MVLCFSEIVNGQCMGRFLGSVSSGHECCLSAAQGGLDATENGGFVFAGTEECFSCIIGKSLVTLQLHCVNLNVRQSK